MNPPRTPTNARERTGPTAHVPAPASGHTGHPGASRRRAGPCTPLLVPTRPTTQAALRLYRSELLRRADSYTAHGAVTEYWAYRQAADCQASR